MRMMRRRQHKGSTQDASNADDMDNVEDNAEPAESGDNVNGVGREQRVDGNGNGNGGNRKTVSAILIFVFCVVEPGGLF